MLSRAVKAHLLGERNILFDRLHGGSRKTAALPISLIKNKPLVKRLVIKKYPAVLANADLPHAESGMNGIEESVTEVKININVEKIGMLRGPIGDLVNEILLHHIDCISGILSVGSEKLTLHLLAIVKDLDLQKVCHPFAKLYFSAEGIRINVGCDREVLNRILAHEVQPYTLPNSAVGGIPAAEGCVKP